MRLRRQSDGNSVILDSHSVIAAGGEARVYGVSDQHELLAKVYRKPTEIRASKLQAMVANPPSDPMAAQGHVSIAWPVDLLETIDSARATVGFVMPRAEGTRRVIDFYNPMSRRRECPLFDYRYLHRAARNLAAAVHAVHARGYVIGDVNESNILVTETALITLVDTDSFQVRDPSTGIVYRCPVGKPDYTPPELQGARFSEIDRTPEHDRFGLAVLIFLMLMEGTHPFAGVFEGAGEPPLYAQRIACGAFPYRAGGAPIRPMPHAPPFEIVHSALRKLFLECFETGHRDPTARPSAEAWVAALHTAENSLAVCKKNSQHRYSNDLDLCPWCARTAAFGGRDPFPSRDAAQHGDHLKPLAITQSALPSAAMPVTAPSRVPQPDRAPVAAPATTPRSNAPSVSPPVSSRQPDTSKDAATGPQPAAVLVAPRRQPQRRAAFPSRWIIIAAVLIVGALGIAFAVSRERAAKELAHVSAARTLLNEAHGLRERSATDRSLIDQRIRKAQAAQVEAKLVQTDEARKIEQEARHEIDTANADKEAQEAKSIVEEVMKSIDRYKKQTLTDQQAEDIRKRLAAQCLLAVSHADKALTLDSRNRAASIERVRAYRLTGDNVATTRALKDALALYPDDPELIQLQSLITGG